MVVFQFSPAARVNPWEDIAVRRERMGFVPKKIDYLIYLIKMVCLKL